MSLVALGIAFVVILLAGLVLIAELQTGFGPRRLREPSSEAFGVSGDVHNASFMGLPIDSGHGHGGSCGGIGGYGHGGGCDGGSGHGA
jgi:hypothetical protein